MEKYFEANLQNWEQRVAYHQDSEMYQLAAFKAGKNVLTSIEMNTLAPHVAGKSLLHLQCHFGMDTLSLVRLGAKATGTDFSATALQTARELAKEVELPARFVEANTMHLDQHLDGQFDIIFATYGVIPWLPDLERFAQIVHHFLAPGGLFYLAEFHPTLYMFDFDTQKLDFPYFPRKEPFSEDIQGTYADTKAPIHGKEYFWIHSLEELIQPLAQKGLQLQHFKEYPYATYKCFPNMNEIEAGKYQFCPGAYPPPHIIELMFQKPL